MSGSRTSARWHAEWPMLFREKWSVLDGKTLLQASELKHAQLLADRLISAVGDREQTPTQIDAADRRQRAFSLFVKAYDQARRAIQYVRWEQGDADTIAPSLYSGRGNSNVKRRAEDAAVTPAPVAQVAACQEAFDSACGPELLAFVDCYDPDSTANWECSSGDTLEIVEQPACEEVAMDFSDAAPTDARPRSDLRAMRWLTPNGLTESLRTQESSAWRPKRSAASTAPTEVEVARSVLRRTGI